jgi:hypothetical protein
MWSDELDAMALEQLTVAYVARKRWEAELQAGMIIKYLGEAMGGSAGSTSSPTGSTSGYGQRVAAGDLLGAMGVTLE